LTKPVKSPLRYPGGKSKALGTILPLIPTFKEFREPFLGGGSVLLALLQKNPHASYWGNDLNRDVYSFWKTLRDDGESLVSEVQAVYDSAKRKKSGSALHRKLAAERPRSLLDRAVRFFVLNRITFSGTIEAGGFSQSAFEKRFTQSAIDRLSPVANLLSNTKFSNEDYEAALLRPGKDVVIFLDPPYISATKSKLYGKQGILHTTFDHERFASLVKKSKHKWMITYDDSDEVRHLFSFANLHEWTLQYGMNNFRQATAAAGKELIITNFPVSSALKSNR